MKYAVLFEQGPSSVGAQVPELPSCFAVGNNFERARKIVAEAVEFHTKSLRAAGLPVPEPTLHAEVVDVAA